MRISESKFREIIREEISSVLNEDLRNDLYVSNDLKKTLYLVTEPTQYDPDNPIDRMIDPGSAHGGNGVDLNVIEKQFIEESDIELLMQRLVRSGRDYLDSIYGIFTDKDEAVNYAVDISDEMMYGS